jgi:hypothetical protein
MRFLMRFHASYVLVKGISRLDFDPFLPVSTVTIDSPVDLISDDHMHSGNIQDILLCYRTNPRLLVVTVRGIPNNPRLRISEESNAMTRQLTTRNAREATSTWMKSQKARGKRVATRGPWTSSALCSLSSCCVHRFFKPSRLQSGLIPLVNARRSRWEVTMPLSVPV